MRLLQGGAIVVVPKAADRQEIVVATHQGMGHFGVQRVLDRLRQNYWWRNMGDLVVRVIQACHSCARLKAGFRESGKELPPLPVRGLSYRWGVDFAGPLSTNESKQCLRHGVHRTFYQVGRIGSLTIQIFARLGEGASRGGPKSL